MRSFFKLSILTAVLLLIAGSLLGQGTTGNLAGTVTQDGNPLPGVTVTATSPNLQGSRSAVTNEAGGYNIGALPPGPYTVRFELAGLQTVTRQQQIGVAQNVTVNADLKVSAVAEAITVTASAPAVAETKEVQTNFDHETIDELPTPRTIVGITNLSPGVVAGFNGPAISGGFSFDNLYTVNGAVIQENLRGQPHNLFIEDSIQETTVQIAGISAEFGNFTGGVINAITKSGGNEFSGSLRDTLLNPSWSENSPQVWNNTGSQLLPVSENTDKLNQMYEGTLGGRIIRDRLWFFAAGRKAEVEGDRAFGASASPATYVLQEEEQRLEGKLTGSITSRHSLVASYLEAPIDRINECQVRGCWDETALDKSTGRESSFITGNYNGVITNNFLVEARYSMKEFTFIGTGGEDRDRVGGTPIALAHAGNRTINEPHFCGICTPEERDNDAWSGKLTYYLGTRNLGTHNLTAGFDHWHETRLSNNFQSSSDYLFFTNTTAAAYAPTQAGGVTRLSVRSGFSTMIHFPVLFQSLGSDLNTDALWFNDRWDVNNKWSINVGARYDKNDSTDSKGAVIADDSKISPRVGVSLDTFGNGRLRFNASYGHYVGRLAETIAGSSSAAGTPAQFNYIYNGPDIFNVTAEEALKQVWAWFDSQGGLDAIAPSFSNIPGVATQIPFSLTSPNVEEMAFGVSTQLGGAFLRADFVHRDWNDFYEAQRTLEIGRVALPNGSVVDKQFNVNTDNLERQYDGISLQGAYRLFNRINLGGNYTWSELTGNASNESVGSVVVTETAGKYYPEYYNFEQNNPVGFMSTDQTHKLRAWVGYDLPTFIGNFNFSLLQAFDSGSPYSHVASIDIRQNANFYGFGQPGGLANPGYVAPPTAIGYYFSDRGEFRFDDITSTSLALNYDTNPAWLRGVSFFVQGEVLNMFNEDSGTFDTTVQTASANPAGCDTATPPATGCLKRFNPHTGDQPVEGVHWRKGPTYGKPLNPTLPVISVEGLGTAANASFQLPRTYRVSLGLRF
jgi:hypothetical protein